MGKNYSVFGACGLRFEAETEKRSACNAVTIDHMVIRSVAFTFMTLANINFDSLEP